jgi:Zn-finger nucleic acid-binding protein
MTVGEVTVDVCKGGCGGIWFDNFEIKKFDEPHEAAGEELLDIERNESIVVDYSKRLNCPWLDAGELRKIRSLFNTEQERHGAAHEYFQEVFGGELAAMHAENEEKLARTKKVANMFRFICPTYYIPGKQKWGAF